MLQGTTGSGKTIVSLLAILNVVKSGYQCALMSPTEILAKQHYNLATKVYKNTGFKIDFLTGKTENHLRKQILSKKILICMKLMRLFQLFQWQQ